MQLVLMHFLWYIFVTAVKNKLNVLFYIKSFYETIKMICKKKKTTLRSSLLQFFRRVSHYSWFHRSMRHHQLDTYIWH